MSSWIALSRSEHADAHWKPRQGFAFAAGLQAVPVFVAELTKLLPSYCLGFVKDNDRYQAVCLLGLGEGRNLYVNQENKWLADYVPANLRGFPFTLAENDSGENVLCIDQGHLTKDSAASSLFDSEGNLSPKSVEMFEFLVKCRADNLVTQNACDALANAEILEVWPLTVNRGESEEPLAINGLYRINEKALNTLSGETFAALRQSGALALAYGQLFSMSQTAQLIKRAHYLAKVKELSSPPQDLSGLFGQDDSGPLNFDAFESIDDNR